MVEAAELGHYAYELHAEDDDFGQAGTLVRQVMDDTDREHLAANIIGHASQDVSDDVQRRVIGYWPASTRSWALASPPVSGMETAAAAPSRCRRTPRPESPR